jgi:phosphoesterase RecJ-like protein
MTRDPYAEVWAALNAPATVLVCCHISPDGDALGAALAVAVHRTTLGLPTVLVNDDPFPQRYDFLPLAEHVRRTEDVVGPFATIIALDCADYRRIGNASGLFGDGHTLVNIDHHETNSGYGQLNLVDPDASATCLVLYRLFHAQGAPIGRELALCLYTGIVFDTGGFRYNNTTPEVHLAAADLLSRGIEPFVVADRVLEAMTRAQAELVRVGLSTLTVDETGRIAHIVVTAEMFEESGAQEGDAEVLLPYTRSLSGVEVGILIRQRADGAIKVSLRSRERVDVAEIAVQFGGGGHVRAAGCNLQPPLETAVPALLEVVKRAVARAFARPGDEVATIEAAESAQD